MYQIVVTSCRVHPCDPDNVYPKHFIDEIVAAGVIPSDSCKSVAWILKRVILVKDEKDERTVIEIWRN